MTATGSRRVPWTTLAVFVGAAAAFAAGMRVGVDWMDEGQIVYPSWRVCTGGVPYRDFVHGYGPSLFFLNGALLCVAGADLLVVRVGLLLVKALTVVLAYRLMRRLAPLTIAFGAAAVLVAVWSAPWFVSTTPYATYYVTLLGLGAMLLVLGGPRGGLRLLAAGVLIGLGTTFKQTAGAFAAIALVLFLLGETAGREGRSAGRGGLGIGLLRALVVLAAIAVCVAYLGRHALTWSGGVLAAPTVVGALAILARDVRAWGCPEQRQGVVALLWAGAGMLVPLVAYAGYFLAVGGAERVLADTVDLLARLQWFVPIALPEARQTAFIIALGGALAAVAPWHRRGVAVAWATLSIVAAVAYVLQAPTGWLTSRGWQADAVLLLPWVPVILPWGTLRAAPLGGTRAPPAARLAWLYAVTNLLQLYPAGDVYHASAILPTCLPLAAYLAGALCSPPGRRAAVAGTAVTLVGAMVAAPSVDGLVRVLRVPDDGVRLARARGIRGNQPKFAHAAALLAWLDAADTAHAAVFVVPNDPLLYVLAGRVSPVDREEFVLYLVKAGLLPQAEVERLVDEDALIARLTAARPLVVDEPGAPGTTRLRQALPRLAAALDRHWRPVATFGGYRVLAWTD